jgi:hypothetical protein
MHAAYERESGVPWNAASPLCQVYAEVWDRSWTSAETHAPEEAAELAEVVEAKAKPTRQQRADHVRREYAASRMQYPEAVGRLMWIYPSLRLSKEGWGRLLTGDPGAWWTK